MFVLFTTILPLFYYFSLVRLWHLSRAFFGSLSLLSWSYSAYESLDMLIYMKKVLHKKVEKFDVLEDLKML